MDCKMTDKIVLVTGATGFLGTQIIQRLLTHTDNEINVLIRGEDPQRRLSRAWWEFPLLIENIGQRIQLYNGDITQKHLNLTEEDYNNLTQKTTHIIHTAADLRLNAPLEELRKTNVTGTINLLELAQNIHDDHGLERFSHVSTAYVAGASKGIINEDVLTSEYGFLSNYEKTKYESELQVKNSNLPINIYRPSMIVGDSKTGYIKTFNTLYVPLRLYLTGKQRILPIYSTTKINLIPVDYVADAITKLTFKTPAEGVTFHLTAPYDSLPTVKELLKSVQNWALTELDYKLPQPLYMPYLASYLKKLSKSRFLTGKNKRLLKTINTLAPYLNENRQFRRDNTDKYMGAYNLKWQDYLPHLLEYAIYNGFFHRSNRTVHEQILFRLKSHSHPIEYYDIINSEYETRTPLEMRRDIQFAVKSLIKIGVVPGDRVAIVGFNNTRYLTLDVAVGLVGAISVPLYYTSSIEEIKEIIMDSKATILFIGTPSILNKLKEYGNKFTIINFTHESEDEQSPEIMNWTCFLEYGSELLLDDKVTAPVDFNDTATIRYTSGTTGKPRGVTFTHGNLRWLAEYIASMPPWKDRNNTVSYLSLLPLNHVVEGILGLYGPYYAPAALKLYFLEDFQDLPQTLPQVRPTIFFSVPRFYEKVWTNVQESRIGAYYLKSSDNIKKQLYRRLIRNGILKKTGLDHCAQLIVGSAPMSEDLLKNFQDLGIEIYNAYGLTEAPLVTINRLDNNKIRTVGEPLPLTRIRLASDNEVMVQGPQVTNGYYNTDETPLVDGWLRTGDYGYLTKDGSLVITGRKKEVIVNSYGKTINPLKIEFMIRDIPGVNEALLIGEGKPYCSALLWTDESTLNNNNNIREAIGEINLRLSRPEEIKKWVTLLNDLSIENGDLTANLKLKRKNILKRYKTVLNFIYHETERPPEILYYDEYNGDIVN